MAQSIKKYVLHFFLLVYTTALIALIVFAGNLAYIISETPSPDSLTTISFDTVLLDKIPPYVGSAFLASEGIRYNDRPGMEIRAVIKTLIRGYLNKVDIPQEITIVQKLVRYAFKTPDDRFARKLQEAYLSFYLQNKYNRKQILQMYVNHGKFGQSVFGIKDASKLYFGKKPQQLSVAQAALLAGIVKNPNANSPYISSKNAYDAMNSILTAMESGHLISKSQYQAALKERVVFLKGPLKN